MDVQDRRSGLEDRRMKKAVARRENADGWRSILKLLFCAFVAIMLILITSLLLDIKIMLTDSLDQQNYIRQSVESMEE